MEIESIPDKDGHHGAKNSDSCSELDIDGPQSQAMIELFQSGIADGIGTSSRMGSPEIKTFVDPRENNGSAGERIIQSNSSVNDEKTATSEEISETAVSEAGYPSKAAESTEPASSDSKCQETASNQNDESSRGAKPATVMSP